MASLNSLLAEPITYRKQDSLLKPLTALSPKYNISCDGASHYVESGGKKIKIIVLPAMWAEPINTDAIYISDKMVNYALPKVDKIIREKLF